MTYVNRNLNRRMRGMLYAMERLYGTPVDVYKKGDQVVNYSTGIGTIEKEVYPIKRAIVMTAKELRESVQTLPIVSANKAFSYGGVYDTNTRMVIVNRLRPDAVTLPDLGPNDWFVYDGKKYEIKSFEEFEFGAAYILIGRQVVGDVPEQIFLLKADNLLEVADTGGAA